MNEAVTDLNNDINALGGDTKVGPTDGSPPLNPADSRVSSKMELLIRREQQALRLEQRARQREAELDAKAKAFEEREARMKEFDSVKTGNSKKALDLLGMNYDQLTQSVLKDGEIPPEVQIKRLEEKLEQYQSSLSKRDEEAKLQAQAMNQRQEQKAISDFKDEIGSYVKENSGRYEYTIYENAEEQIFKEIDEHYGKTIDPDTGVGVVMSMKEAADKIEEKLEQKYIKARELKKTQAYMAAAQARKSSFGQSRELRPQTPPRTLTNQMTATPQPKRTHPLTDEERKQKAIAYARGLRPGL